VVGCRHVRAASPSIAAFDSPLPGGAANSWPTTEKRKCGLGLSIAQAVAQRHGLSIALENRPDAQGFSVRVSGAANDGGLIRS